MDQVDALPQDRARAAAEHARGIALIAEADRAYYEEDAPVMDDAAYDALRRRVAGIEARFPDLASPDEPTACARSRAGGGVRSRSCW